MRSKFIFAVVTALFVGLLGLPASANINDVGVLNGVAEVGKTFWDGDDCDKTGKANVVGRGLFVVGTPQDQAREAQGAWHLLTVAAPRGIRLEACGWLDAVEGTGGFQWPGQTDPRTKGIGAACGASRGHSGMGEFGPLGAPLAKLMHLGWASAVGGLLPVTGQYQEYVAGGPAKGKKGTVLAEVLAAGGGGACANAVNGAQAFTVVGTFELVNAVVVPKEPTKQCKETDPDKDKDKEQVAGSDADWKRDCPTAKK